MGRSHAYRLIEAFAVIDNLSPIGDVVPKNEAQARPLTQLNLFTQKKVWRDFLKTGKPISALNIKKFVSDYLGKKKTSNPFTEFISKDYKAVVVEMLSQITIAQNDLWKSTSVKTALYWNNVMKEKIQWGYPSPCQLSNTALNGKSPIYEADVIKRLEHAKRFLESRNQLDLEFYQFACQKFFSVIPREH